MERRILVVDDDRNMCDVLEAELRGRAFEVQCATTQPDALSLFEREDFGLAIADVNMGAASGVDLCKQFVARREEMPVIVVTAFGSMETAVSAIRAGAYDFVTKPFDVDELVITIERALRHRALRDEVTRLRKVVAGTGRLGEMLGASGPMQTMGDLIARVADSDATVLVTGESGTGKELVAKALHASGARRDKPFVAINCAAMPESLLESELFGHAKGAFTDARASRQGLFVQAGGGTLFLDEIGEMPLGMQAKVLRALQERVVRPVGGDAEQPFDTRIIAATNRDLETEVDEKRFRADLFYRINVVRIQVPPLRARGADVLSLAHHFIERYASTTRRGIAGMTSGVADRLTRYPWPGNVRELQNSMERAVALGQFDRVGVDDLPDKIRDYKPTSVSPDADDPASFLPMEEVERRYILRVLEAVGGNKTLAAQVLGFDRRTLYRKLERVKEHGGPSPSEPPKS